MLGLDDLVNVSWSLLAHLVASWNGFPFCGCCPFPDIAGKYFCFTSLRYYFCALILFLYNEQALISAIVKRIKGFIKLNMALSTLHGALPDATPEELRSYDDECAICRVR